MCPFAPLSISQPLPPSEARSRLGSHTSPDDDAQCRVHVEPLHRSLRRCITPRAAVPRLLVAIWAIDLVMQLSIAQAVAASGDLPRPVATNLGTMLDGNVRKVLISAALWSPYLLLSRRVNVTFRSPGLTVAEATRPARATRPTVTFSQHANMVAIMSRNRPNSGHKAWSPAVSCRFVITKIAAFS